MKRFKQFVNEVYDHGDTGQHNKMGMERLLGQKITDAHKHIGNIGKHKVYHRKEPKQGHGLHSYSVADHEGTITNSLLVKPHRHHMKVVLSATSGGGPKQHELYHHLITKHDKVITTDAQTTGGHAIWKRLAKKRSVNIHGWDPKKGKPVNIDHRLRDKEETHHDVIKDKEHGHIERMHLVAHKK